MSSQEEARRKNLRRIHAWAGVYRRLPDPGIPDIPYGMAKIIEDDAHAALLLPDPEEAASRKELRDIVAKILEDFEPNEAKVLRARFGLGAGLDKETGETLEDVAARMGVTRERIRQIEAKALRKLRHPSRSDLLRCFSAYATAEQERYEARQAEREAEAREFEAKAKEERYKQRKQILEREDKESAYRRSVAETQARLDMLREISSFWCIARRQPLGASIRIYPVLKSPGVFLVRAHKIELGRNMQLKDAEECDTINVKVEIVMGAYAIASHTAQDEIHTGLFGVYVKQYIGGIQNLGYALASVEVSKI